MPHKKPDALKHIAEQLRPLAQPIAALKPDPRNAREHGEKNLAAIAASLKQFGQRKPIVVNRKNHQVEAGNGLLEAAKSLKWTHLAVVWVDDESAAQTGFSLADNRAAELATWDHDTLGLLLVELRGDNEELYDALAYEELCTALSEQVAADEPPAASPGKASAAADAEDGDPAGEDDENADAAGDPAEPAAQAAAAQPVPEQYAVVIDCRDEQQQRLIYEKCQAEGWQCRLLSL